MRELVLGDRFSFTGHLYRAVVGEERYRLQPHALEDPLVQELTEVSELQQWTAPTIRETQLNQ